jgi:hypothetical protein
MATDVVKYLCFEYQMFLCTIDPNSNVFLFSILQQQQKNVENTDHFSLGVDDRVDSG